MRNRIVIKSQDPRRKTFEVKGLGGCGPVSSADLPEDGRGGDFRPDGPIRRRCAEERKVQLAATTCNYPQLPGAWPQKNRDRKRITISSY
jgi:hypothetical protein